MEDRKQYEGHLDQLAAKWKAELEVLKAQAGRAQVSAQVNYERSLEELHAKQEAAQRHLQDLKAATDESWESIKDHAEQAWEDVKDAFERLTGKT